MWSKIKAAWEFFNGRKLIWAGYLATATIAVQMLVMDEFNLDPIWWQHATSILDKIIVTLGGVGLAHKGVKAAQKYVNRDVVGG